MGKTAAGLVVAAAGLASAAVLLSVFPARTLEISASADHAFVIDEDMERVRKVLVRTNSVKTIVAMANARLKDQEWLELEFGSDGPLPVRNWNLEGEGKLTVVSDDPWLGAQELILDQKIQVQPERLESLNTLREPADSIRDYRSSLVLTPDSRGKAAFHCRVQLTVRTSCSWFTCGAVEAGIQEAPAGALQKMEQAIRDLVARHDGEVVILPTGIR